MGTSVPAPSPPATSVPPASAQAPSAPSARPARRRGPSPGAVLAFGAFATGALIAFQLFAGPSRWLAENVYIVLAPATGAVALVLRARSSQPRQLDYGVLAVAATLIALGLAVTELDPIVGRTLAGAGSNGLFGVASLLAALVILPALYRHMDRRQIVIAVLDSGILMSAGTTLALTVWRSDQATSVWEVIMPVVSAAVLASTGVAVITSLQRRARLGLFGVWVAMPAVAILGLAWISLVDSLLHGVGRGTSTSVLASAGALLIGYGWISWSDRTEDNETYRRVADLLGDWLPNLAIAGCLAAVVLPHGRIEGIDFIWLGTVGVVGFSVARQRFLAVREREISQRLVGEQRLRAEKEAAEAANKAKSVFLATMSHEIRTPLNAILGNATLLGEANLGPAERESVEAIESAGEALLSVIDDVLDFSKIEADRLTLERVGFNPDTLIRQLVSMFSINARDKGLTLEAEIDPSIPVFLAGDPHRLHQVLSNLIGNAIKFTSSGGVTVRALVLERTAQETRLRFEVSDTGIGIDEVARERLFSPFVQVDASMTRRFGGSGLGLAICKRLVGMMGGEIAVESRPGSGSTFWFTTRLASPTDEEAGAVLLANEYVGLPVDTIGARVLVAEDNAANVRLMERLLGRLQMDVVCVGTGAAAVRAVEEGNFDLVLMDVHMPEMDGLEATQVIRATGSKIPIVALTANAQGSDRLACLAAGMDDYLSKPVKSADLSAALHRWLPGGEMAGRSGGPAPQKRPAAAASPAALFPDVIDAAQMSELLALDPDGSAGFLAAMIGSFQETLTETMPLIGRAVATRDREALEDAAHKLKGVAANMGLVKVNEAAAKLVDAARSGEMGGVVGLFAALQTAVAPAHMALEDLLVHVSASSPDSFAA